MIIHVKDDLLKSKLREKFAEISLKSYSSNYKFLNELRDAITNYSKRANIKMVNGIISSMSSTSKLNKSIPINIHSLIEEEDNLLLKAIFSDFWKNVSKRLKFWKNKKPKAPRKVNVIYDTEKDDLTGKEWESIDDALFYYLDDEQSKSAVALISEAYKLGIQAGDMQKEYIPTENLDYDQMKEWSNANDYAEKLKAGGLSSSWANAAAFARERAAEGIAVYEDGERKGTEYEVAKQMFRDQIAYSLENEEDINQLRSRLIFPENWIDVEGHQQKLSEKLSPEELKKFTVAHLNRNWDRFAFNEVQYAFNNGRLLNWSKFITDENPVYLEFGKVSGGRKTCEYCEEHRGTMLRLFSSYQEFKDSPNYDGEDRVKDDDIASVAVWPGKNNYERIRNNWWLCAPVHNWCTDDYLLVG